MIRKIDLMHKLFGEVEHKCGDCCHFVEGEYHGKMLRKCEVYGLTHSSASDWAKRSKACGLYNKETANQNVMNLVKTRHPATNDPADLFDKSVFGQITFDDYEKGEL